LSLQYSIFIRKQLCCTIFIQKIFVFVQMTFGMGIYAGSWKALLVGTDLNTTRF